MENALYRFVSRHGAAESEAALQALPLSLKKEFASNDTISA
jgi:hypothetical protein